MLSCFSMAASAKVGDVIGKALHTDIVAYINNYAVPSYAVNGQSVIVAEDLRNFGFDVAWDEYTRSLTITRNSSTWVNSMDFNKSGEFGKKFTNILQTDIKVYAGGKQITSYAMNGYTMIPIEELTMFGEVYWVAGERAIKLWVDGLTIRPTMQKIEVDYPITSKTYTFSTALCGNGYDVIWVQEELLTIESAYSYENATTGTLYAKAPATLTFHNFAEARIYKFSSSVTPNDFVNRYFNDYGYFPPTSYATFSLHANQKPVSTLPKGYYILDINTGGNSTFVQVIVE